MHWNESVGDPCAAVFDHWGKALGLIRQPGVSNMGFAGKGLGTLYMLNGSTISYVTLQVLTALSLFFILPKSLTFSIWSHGFDREDYRVSFSSAFCFSHCNSAFKIIQMFDLHMVVMCRLALLGSSTQACSRRL